MIVVFGASDEQRDIGDAKQMFCAACNAERPQRAVVHYRLGHVFWILNMVKNKRFARVCEVCQTSTAVPQTSIAPELLRSAIPLYHRYSALGFIVLAIAGLGVADLLERRDVANAVAAPRVGDQFVANAGTWPGLLTGGGFSILKVLSVRGGTIELCSGMVLPEASGAKRCQGRSFSISQTELAAYYDAGAIPKVYRAP
jgi:hypothetical protein